VGHEPRKRRVARGLTEWRWSDLRRGAHILVRSRFMLRVLYGAAICFAVVMIAALGLWWRLSSGPIELNLATPWLKAAIEENFGGNHSVAVGGTHSSSGMRRDVRRSDCDIVVRDADGTVVAALRRLGWAFRRSLLMGRLRAQSLNLVRAEMSVPDRDRWPSHGVRGR
jgi:hypothetical protein